MAIGASIYFFITILVAIYFIKKDIEKLIEFEEDDYFAWAEHILGSLFTALAWPIILVVMLFYFM